MGGRSAIVVAVDLPASLEALRRRETDDARRGIPAHVTLLFPFVAATAIDDEVRSKVRRAVAGHAPLEVELSAVRRFEPSTGSPAGVLWLAPEPAEPFVALTRSLVAAFPGLPPYGGVHAEVVPHVTIATADARRFDDLQAEALRSLPIRQVVTDTTLLLETPDGRWRIGERFGLA